MAKLQGIVTALITPLEPNGGLDEGAFAQLIERQLAAGIHAIFVLGSIGEGVQVAGETYRRAVRCAVQVVRGRAPLLCGAGDNSVQRCLERLEIAGAAGADSGVLTLPFYGWPGGEEEGVEFFSAVAAGSPIPITAYNLPKTVHWDMPLSFVERLFAIPNLTGMKDTRNALPEMAAIAGSSKRPGHFFYMPGNSALAASLWAAGADGLVSTPSNVYPRLFVELWNAFQADRADEVERLSRIAGVACRILGVSTGSAAVKCALEIKGLCRRWTVRPWPQADGATKEKIRSIMAEVENDWKE